MNPYYIDLFKIFERAHLEKIHVDGKAITDAIAKEEHKYILEIYKIDSIKPDFNFKTFFNTYFEYPASVSNDFKSDVNDDLQLHIKKLWPLLTKKAKVSDEISSMIDLPHDYIVPGGRFGEVYYWDTYFTMLGMKQFNLHNEIKMQIENFAFLINKFGYIPNGNREYYLGRSQPPFFTLMVELLATIEDNQIFEKYADVIEKEYEFFTSPLRIKNIENWTVSSYYDTHDGPRMEMYGEDVALSQGIINKNQFYRNIRAACESGWDFCSRWLYDAHDLTTICTLDIVPIDLNCLLYKMEEKLALHSNKKEYYHEKKMERIGLINNVHWNESQGVFNDYNLKLQCQSEVVSCATLFPLFVGIASDHQAGKVAKIVEEHLLHDGGLTSTNIFTQHQWDAPNGWAPLQWIAYVGLKNYGHFELASEIKQRWMKLNETVFRRTGKLMEKYNVVDLSLEAGGGEYDVQDGFGWTNGVYIAMKCDSIFNK
jgi:alpha,alpha-trehalase